ncbi:hypothetical protein [Gordonia jinghuaiqii]|uniref:Uncharacterized protein n=1 Tax=Gordonia jinghuaiqii TaxID=2758710 RepID=A0A7D7LXN0_9ACTN|nr:hypothetical protein [Gordonia jinghuaiqii]QMT01336.1 hypothetical protein H1R19_21345 [Gordonia jinghuaiqii]
MRVFVTGGTGAIGGYAVPALVAAAVAADVPRVLQESVAMVYVDSGDRWI